MRALSLALPLLAVIPACGPRIPDGAQEAVMDCQVVHDDPFELVAARVPADDTLELVVSYGGGCKEHSFYTCWDGEFLENDPAVFSEANPPRARIALGHHGRGDGCEAEETATLDFWLTPLREAYAATHDNGATRLVIELGEQSVQYPFPE
jgi:hypothetical protein